MKRRDFLCIFWGGAIAAWPVLTRAQQKTPVIGYMGATTPSVQRPMTAAFAQRLRQLGWTEGGNVVIEYRWAEGSSERFAEIAAEFVRLKVDVMITPGSAALAAKTATSTIPIVFAAASDPVGSGLVASLARPGGNVTGLSLQSSDLASKRLELLREVVPRLHRLAVMANTGYSAATIEIREVQNAANSLGIETEIFGIRETKDISPAFEAMKGRVNALYLITDPLITNSRARINILALGARLPAMYGFREGVVDGGLISYGPDFTDSYAHAADLVDKILRGTSPANIPVEQPTKFALVVNQAVANAIGLAFTSTLLARADEVIE